MAEEEKLWRFLAVIGRCDVTDEHFLLNVENPVPLFSGDRVVGAANVFFLGDRIIARCVAEYSIPERLDLESAHFVGVVPKQWEQSFMGDFETKTSLHIDSLCFSCDKKESTMIGVDTLV